MINNQKKLPPEQRQLTAQLKKTENGQEVTVIARDCFFEPGKDGKQNCNIETDATAPAGIKQQPDDVVITFDRAKLQNLYQERTISQDIYNSLIEMLNNHNKALELSERVNNPNEADHESCEQELQKVLSADPTDQIAAMRSLLMISESFINNNNVNQKTTLRNKHINPEIIQLAMRITAKLLKKLRRAIKSTQFT